jgi:hypothetical protein
MYLGTATLSLFTVLSSLAGILAYHVNTIEVFSVGPTVTVGFTIPGPAGLQQSLRFSSLEHGNFLLKMADDGKGSVVSAPPEDGKLAKGHLHMV